MRTPSVKWMTKGQEVLFNKTAESNFGSIVRIKENLGQGYNLGRSIPSMRAMNKYGNAIVSDMEGGLP